MSEVFKSVGDVNTKALIIMINTLLLFYRYFTIERRIVFHNVFENFSISVSNIHSISEGETFSCALLEETENCRDFKAFTRAMK